MVELLIKKLVPDNENVNSSQVREGYGAVCGAVGISLNLIMVAMKLVAGIMSGAISIVADAINNLGDAGSSVIMLVGFKMAGKKPNPKHPFGHGRIEYITGLIVSFLVILMGVELLQSSVEKILHPEKVAFSIVTAVILVISIMIKLYMYAYNIKVSKKISSHVMKATAMDSLTDSVATLVVLIAMLIYAYTGFNADGICGLLVSAFIIYTGVTSAKDTLDPLLGTTPSKEFVETIEKFATSHEGILGVHDLVVHDYGPGRLMISFHAEVPADVDILKAHDMIDIIEAKLNTTLNCHATIHMDPIVVNDEENDRMRRLCELIAKSIDESFKIHDFRMVKGDTHTNLIFDVLAPYSVALSEEEITNLIFAKVRSLPGNHFAVVKVDRPFV